MKVPNTKNLECGELQRIKQKQKLQGCSNWLPFSRIEFKKLRKKDKKNANDNDEDYVPEYEGGLGSNSSSENYENDKRDEFGATNDLESQKRKVSLEIFSI